MKKRNVSAFLSIALVLVVVAVLSKQRHDLQTPEPMESPVITASQESVAVQDLPAETEEPLPSPAQRPADAESDSMSTARMLFRAAPIPVGPVRGMVSIYDTIQGSGEEEPAKP